MNMWNRDFVHAHYAVQAKDFLKSGPDGEFSVIAGERPLVMGQTIVSDSCDFGWMAAWASEMGDDTTLRGLLRHADRHMSPRWSDGGFHEGLTKPLPDWTKAHRASETPDKVRPLSSASTGPTAFTIRLWPTAHGRLSPLVAPSSAWQVRGDEGWRGPVLRGGKAVASTHQGRRCGGGLALHCPGGHPCCNVLVLSHRLIQGCEAVRSVAIAAAVPGCPPSQ